MITLGALWTAYSNVSTGYGLLDSIVLFLEEEIDDVYKKISEVSYTSAIQAFEINGHKKEGEVMSGAKRCTNHGGCTKHPHSYCLYCR